MSAPTTLRVVSLLAGLCVLLLPAADAAAQVRERRAVKPSRFEIGGGVGWVGQSDAGTRDATFTSNQPGEDPDPFVFFQVNGRTRSGLVGSGWVGANVTDSVGVEVGFGYSQPSLRANITADVEGAPETTIVTSTFTQTQVEGNVLYYFNNARFDNDKTVPFIFGGAGIQMQRDTGEDIDENAAIYQAGIGFKWFSRIERLRAKGMGLRLDFRYVVRDGGVDYSEGVRSFVALNATAAFSF
jgi:outer membrane protein with beta-barrel domain